MKARPNLFRTFVTLAGALALSISAQAWQGMPVPKSHVSGRFLQDTNGNNVLLHGWMQPMASWFNGQGKWYSDPSDWNNTANVSGMLTYLENAATLMSDSSPKYSRSYGWYCSFVRVNTDSIGGWTSAAGLVDTNQFNGWIQNFVVPYANHLKSHGLYLVLSATGPINTPNNGTHNAGVTEQQRLITFWQTVANAPGVKSADNIMFELMNEPVDIESSPGNGDWGNHAPQYFLAFRNWIQPVIDAIRNTGADNVIWVPTLEWQGSPYEHAQYPFTGTNCGIACHYYPAYGGVFDNATAVQNLWNSQYKPAADLWPMIITECFWTPYPQDPGNLVNGHTAGFGDALKKAMDNQGNVSYLVGFLSDLLDDLTAALPANCTLSSREGAQAYFDWLPTYTWAGPTSPGTPLAPTSLTATAVSGSQINLGWTANATNATGYLVERSSDNVHFLRLVSLDASATTYSDTFLPGSSTYYYRVQARNNNLYSLYSNTTNATTQLGVPAAPSGLTVLSRNVTLRWNASSGTPASSYNVKRSTTNGGPYTLIGTSAGTILADTAVTNGSTYYYVVSGVNSYGESSNSVQVAVTPLPTALPAPWLDLDIGNVGLAGSGSYSNTFFSVAGSGADIWGNADAFHYAYFAASGNCTLIARVASVQNTDPWAKAGVMIRESLGAGSTYAMLAITPGNGASFQYRTSTGGSSANTATSGPSASYWVKLVRSGTSFSAYISPDGNAWTQVGTARTITMASAVYVGLPVTAHNNTNLCTATFDNVWSTAPVGTWMHQDIGSVGLAGSASFSTSPFTIVGSGSDIWGTSDAFNFACLSATGNCTVVTRVASMENADAWSKAGLMIRETLNANSTYAFIAVTPSNGVTWQYRASTGGSSANSSTAGLRAPYWIKLVRSGNTFSGYRSADGTNWNQQGTSQTFTMAQTAYIGLAVTSHNNAKTCMATFDNVAVPGWPVPALTPPSPVAQLVSGNQLVLSWSWGTLVQATNLLGPWIPVANAASPYTNSTTAPQQFFRISNP